MTDYTPSADFDFSALGTYTPSADFDFNVIDDGTVSLVMNQQWALTAAEAGTVALDQSWALAIFSYVDLAQDQAWGLNAPRFDNVPHDAAWSLLAPAFRSVGQDAAWSLLSATFANTFTNQRWALLTPDFADLPQDQIWNLIAPFGGGVPLSQQWSLEATAVWTKVISATAYLFTLEHPDEGISEFPISNFSGQMRSGENSYLQCSIPNATAYADAITLYAAHEDTEMAISAGYRWSDGSYTTQEIARTTLRNFRQDYGSRSNTISLDGLDTRTNLAPKSVTLTGASYRSVTTTGLRRYRCAMDFSVRPGDTVTVNDETFVVGELSYQVDAENATMEVAETVPA